MIDWVRSIFRRIDLQEGREILCLAPLNAKSAKPGLAAGTSSASCTALMLDRGEVTCSTG